MDDFERFGRESGTDKVSHHGYQRFYPRFLQPMRGSVTGMLEIGILHGQSVRMWEKYFPRAFVYGIDLNAESSTPRSRIFRADQSNADQLTAVRQQITRPVQFILDDGSHVPEHQMLAFDLYFSALLQPGGVYIVEDVETSYWARGEIYGYPTRYGHLHPRSFVELCKPLVDDVNAEFLSPDAKASRSSPISQATRDWISSVTFGQNCIIFTKKTQAERQTYERPYRFGTNL